MDNTKILIYILLYLNIISLVIGYIIAKLLRTSNQTNYSDNIKRTQNKSTTQSNNITIDDKKIVLDINTSGLEKKYSSLGQVTQTETNISESVNKLKNLKK